MKRKLLYTVALTSLFALNAGALPFSASLNNDVYDSTPDAIPTPNSNNDGVPDLNDAVNLLLGTSYANNEDIDFLMIDSDLDDVWTAATGTGQIGLIGLTAEYLNTIGFYTDLGVGSAKTALRTDSGFGFIGDGNTAGTAFVGATITSGGSFGFYLESDSGSGVNTYYSEVGLNPSGLEHMVSYQLPGLAGTQRWVDFGSGAVLHTFTAPVLVGWEDLPLNLQQGVLGDDDYDDMMYVFDAIAPSSSVPSTGSTAGMLACALMLFAGIIRFRGTKLLA